VCLCANFQFSWWSRDHFSAPFRGSYLPNPWSQTLQTSKRNIFSLGFPSIPLVLGKTISCRLCAGQSKGTLKTRKMLFWDLAPPTLKNSTFFHDSTRPHLHFDGLLPKSWRSVVWLRVRYKYYKNHSRFGLAWSCPCADRGLHRPTSVFHTTIGVCKILYRSVEIWQYEGQKSVFE